MTMLRNFRPNALAQIVTRNLSQAEGARVAGIHEPHYLEDLKPKVGFYERLNLSLTGYDFVVLEKYQSYIHRRMNHLKFEIIDAWSSPCKEMQLEALVDRSTAVESAYKLKLYERNIRMKNALVTKLPLLIDLLHHTTPAGVKFTIDRHTATDEDRLYFKDSVLEKFKEELRELEETPLIGA